MQSIRNLTRRFGLGALALTALVLAAQAQQDKIQLRDGKERIAKILSEDLDGLSLSVEGGGTTGLRWKQIESFRYATADKYYKALDAFSSGNLPDAIAQLEALNADAKLRAPIKHGVLFHLGSGYQKLGRTEDAIATFETLLDTHSKSRHLLTVGANLLSLYRAKGTVADGAKRIDSKLSALGNLGSDPSLSLGIGTLRGVIAEELGKFADAERIFETMASTAGAEPGDVANAKLGLARCAQRSGRTSDAEKRYRELVSADVPNHVLAGAWNGLGDLMFEPALAKKDQNALREALFAYLRGVVLYVPGPSGPTDEYERALAGSAKTFKTIGELDADPARKRLFLDRAKQSRDQLAAAFPLSRWLKGL
jgi:tetratricopeptide (TPR) repeat protein